MKKESFVYDRTLRELLQDIPTAFIKLLINKKAVKMLDSKFPNVEEKEADLVVELEDKEILHIEIQTTNDNNMPHRMLYYALMIYKVHNKFPKQLVIYVGEDNIKINNTLTFNDNYFSYEVKNIKDIDCTPLIESDNVNDNILSILCDVKDVQQLFFRLKSKLLDLNQKQRENYIRKILYLLRLRPILNQKFLELKNKEADMPFIIEKTKDPLYNEGLYKGKLEGRLEGKLEGRLEGKLESAIIMIKDFNIKPENIAKKLDIPLELVLKEIK